MAVVALGPLHTINMCCSLIGCNEIKFELGNLKILDETLYL